MIIPVYARRYTTTATGEVVRRVICEHCRAIYGYRLRRTVQGDGTSVYGLDNRGAADRSAHAAERTLDAVLAKECDAVPCPRCHRLQNYMWRELRRRYARWLLWVAIVPSVLLTVAAFFIWFAPIAEHRRAAANSGQWIAILLLVAVACATAMLWLRRHLASGLSEGSDFVQKQMRPDLVVELPPTDETSTGQSAQGVARRSRRGVLRLALGLLFVACGIGLNAYGVHNLGEWQNVGGAAMLVLGLGGVFVVVSGAKALKESAFASSIRTSSGDAGS